MTYAKCLAILALTLTVSSGGVQGGTINLNDVWNGGNPFVGTDVMFTNVIETNGPANQPAVNYYQSPVAIGNRLVVNPVDFRLSISPGPGIQFLDSQLEMVIMADPGQFITSIAMLERGDYLVAGLNPNDALVGAELNFFWEVLAGASAGVSGSGTATFSAMAGPLTQGEWSLNANVNLAAFPGATKVRFEFDNRLNAQATATGAAFIAKKQIPLIEVTTVPEPVGAAVLGLTLGLLSLRRRRP